MDARTTLTRRRGLGAALILATGVLHLIEAPEYYGEVKYIGALFVACMIGAAVAAKGIWEHRGWGWWLGIAVAGGSALAYVASRTVGLPQFRENSWGQALEPMGVLSMAVELAYLTVAVVQLNVAANAGVSPTPLRRSYES